MVCLSAGRLHRGWRAGQGVWPVCKWLSWDWLETRGKGDEVMARRKGWAGEQAGRRGECLCQFCFPAPHFTRSADNLVWALEKDEGAEGMKLDPGF